MKRMARMAAVAALGVATVTVAGCREDEQDRVLMFDKGVYLGEPDQALADDAMGDLRRRAENQGF